MGHEGVINEGPYRARRLFHEDSLFREMYWGPCPSSTSLTSSRSLGEDLTPILIKGIAVNFRDQACGHPIAVRKLIQPALSYFQFERDCLNLNALMPP